MKMTFQERIEHYIESGFQAIYIPTAERSRCEDELSAVAKKLGMTFATWDGINGVTEYDVAGAVRSTGKFKDPLEVLMAMDDIEAKCVWDKEDVLFVMRNFHMFLEDGAVRQQFQNLYYGRKLSNVNKRPIIIMANAMQIQAEISPCITVAEFSLPDEVQLGAVFSEIADNIEIDESRPGAIAKYDEEGQSRIIQAMRGLTTLEAENVLAYSLRVNRGFAPGLVDTIEDQKASALEKSEVLTYVPKERIMSMDDIGGYEELKLFIAERKLSYTKAAKELGMDLPRGIVLLGVPGCVADDTVVYYKRGERSSGRFLPIREFHDKFNHIDYHGSPTWNKDIDTYLHSFDAETGKIFYNKVTAVVDKGQKQCIRIRTNVAGDVTLTCDHPVLTADATFIDAGEVTKGMTLLVRGDMKPHTGNAVTTVRRPRVTVEALKYHPHAWRHTVIDQTTGKEYIYGRTHRARLLIEARMNHLEYGVLINILKTCPELAENLVYLDPTLEVHHINEDPTDDRIENLMVMTKAEHTRLHCDETRFNVEYTRQAVVTSVESMGLRQTYDVSMALPCANFVVNDGIIVHNTGKSVVGKVIAKDLGLPLVVIDVSAVFGSLMGESERRIREALKTIDALDGAVALVDEAEKALGGAGGDSNGDSGTSKRVFGVLLNWLTEKTSRTFVVMTMNRTRGIPPEFLRKGR